VSEVARGRVIRDFDSNFATVRLAGAPGIA
jgi:hypothetical protein